MAFFEVRIFLLPVSKRKPNAYCKFTYFKNYLIEQNIIREHLYK